MSSPPTIRTVTANWRAAWDQRTASRHQLSVRIREGSAEAQNRAVRTRWALQRVHLGEPGDIVFNRGRILDDTLRSRATIQRLGAGSRPSSKRTRPRRDGLGRVTGRLAAKAGLR